jgi:V8-like Glu-specific endopeptidase
VWAAGAQAVTANGFPDNGLHPNAGAIMVPARSGVGYAEVCSGTLVSRTIFLTAGHCTAFLEADRGLTLPRRARSSRGSASRR